MSNDYKQGFAILFLCLNIVGFYVNMYAVAIVGLQELKSQEEIAEISETARESRQLLAVALPHQ